MKRSASIVNIRQICCSGLAAEVVVREVLSELRTLTSAQNATYSAVDTTLAPDYHIAGCETGSLTGAIPDIVCRYLTPERRGRARRWLQEHRALTDPRVIDADFYLSELYNVIYRPLDMHHLLWCPLIARSTPKAILGLYRSKGQKPFDQRDAATLASVLPYLGHALAAPREQDAKLSERARSGLILMSPSGRIRHMCPEGEQLLRLACHPRISQDDSDKQEVLAALTRLCRIVQGVFRAQDTRPPAHYHRGPHGRFAFHGYRLEGQLGESDMLVGIMVEHREPEVLPVLRALRSLPLSSMQKQVAVLLCQRHSFEEIGRRLSIKQSTVKDHVGKLYLKLDTHRREELLSKLLELDELSQRRQLYRMGTAPLLAMGA